MIKQATLKDFDFFYSLYMHPQVNPFLLYEMMPEADFRPIYEDLIEKTVLYAFIAEQKSVGMFKLVPFTHRSSHTVYLGGLAIDPAFSGQGFGSQMMQEIIDLAEKSGFERLELSVAVSNVKAMQLYEKAGFKKEGVLRKYTYLKSENRYLDEMLMAYILNENY
jgi:RimJ/RimL family protein N-acetyltransferase